MLEIEMPKDLKTVEAKIIGPFTARQIICFIIACSYGIPLFAKLNGDITFKIIVTLLAVIPVLLCGWFKIQGLPFEKFLVIIIRNKFLKPKKRKYKVKNSFDYRKTNSGKVKRSKSSRGIR